MFTWRRRFWPYNRSIFIINFITQYTWSCGSFLKLTPLYTHLHIIFTIEYGMNCIFIPILDVLPDMFRWFRSDLNNENTCRLKKEWPDIDFLNWRNNNKNISTTTTTNNLNTNKKFAYIYGLDGWRMRWSNVSQLVSLIRYYKINT